MSKPNRVVHFHPKYQSSKIEILNLIDDFNAKGKDVVQGDRNAIKRFDLKGESINIKSFRSPTFFNAAVYKFFRKSKAERSFRHAIKLISCGVLTPFPIAYVEEFSAFGLKSSYYVSEHIDFDFDFRVLIHKPKFPDRNSILKQFTEFTFKLHENNINFLDHSPGNTLIIKKANSYYDFYLIDLNRMRFETMSFKKRMYNFRRLWLSKAMLKIMAEAYSKCNNRTYKETHENMLKYNRSFQRKIDAKKLRRAGRKLKFKS